MKAKIIKWGWIALTIAVVGLTLYTIGRNILHIIDTYGLLWELEDEAQLYREQITQDSTLLQSLNYDDLIEQFARERFNMQREGEKVYKFE